jgi:MFS family permease
MGRTIPRYLLSATLVRLADDGSRVLLLLLAIDQLGSASVGGLLVACFLLPHVLAAPTMGALADRAIHRNRFQAGALLGFGLCLASVGALAGSAPIGILVLISLAGGCLGPLVTGGMTSLLALLAPPDARERLYGFDVLSYNAAGIVGPAGSAILAELLGPATATIALGLSAIVGAWLALTLPIPKREATDRTELSIKSLISVDAVHLMFSNNFLRAATLGTSLGAAGTAAIPLASVLLSQEAQKPSWTAILMGATAVGGLLGSSLYTWRPFGAAHPNRVIALALLASAIPFTMATLVADQLLLLMGLFLIAGVPTGPLASSLFLVRNRESPDQLQTQVFTFGAGLKLSSSAVGAFVAGLLADLGSTGILLGISIVHVMAAVLARTSRSRK